MLAIAELHFRSFPLGAGEMAQWLKVCTDLAEDRGSVPSTHIRQLKTAYDFSSRGSDIHRIWHQEVLHGHAQIHTQTHK